MKKQIFIEINLGIGDHLFLKIFTENIKNQYDRIFIMHSRDALGYWFANDLKRLDFNINLANLVFNEPPYTFVPNPRMRFNFFPNERIVKELNNKPTKPNLNCLCVGKSLDINNYVVITTKMRQYPKAIFEEQKEKLTPALQALAQKYTIVILGEREVERTREYEAEVNKHQVFGIYDYLKSILPSDKILDLTVPALGVAVSSISQFQQDCLIMKEAEFVITFGIGGNFWMSAGIAKKTIGLRADSEWTTDLMNDYPNMLLTKDVNKFTNDLINPRL